MAHAISQAAPYYKAPIELRERIQLSLREAIGAPASRSAAGKDSLRVRRPEAVRRSVLFFEMPWSWLALAAAIVLVALSRLLPVTAPWCQSVSRDTTYSQSRPFAHGRSSHGCSLLRSTHGQTVA